MPSFKQIEDKKEWTGSLRKALFSTFFHSLDWEDFLEREFKWLKFERYIYKGELLLSLARFRLKGKERLISHPFCEYGGPLPLKQGIDFQTFQQDLLDEFKQPLRIKFHPRIFTFFANTPSSVADVKNISYFLRGFKTTPRKTLRQTIKKAEAAGLIIKECESTDELKALYNLYLLKSKEHKIPAYPFSFFEHFLKSPQSEIILAKTSSNPTTVNLVAGSVFLKYNGFWHYFLNASSKKAPEGANHLILWHQIQKYSQSDFSVFDLGGTAKGSSLEVFKKGWGGTPEPIYELRNKIEESELKGGVLRKVWGFLPKSAIKSLSPYFLKYKL